MYTQRQKPESKGDPLFWSDVRTTGQSDSSAGQGRHTGQSDSSAGQGRHTGQSDSSAGQGRHRGQAGYFIIFRSPTSVNVI